MPQLSRNRKFSRAALCVFLGLALIVGGTAAVRADDDDEMFDTKLVKKFLRGMGLRNGQEAGIEYKERPPLVVPPGRDLPPPVAADSLSVKNAAWPADPDEKRRAEERSSKNTGARKRDPKTYNSDLAGEDVLMPDQLAQRSNKPSERTSDLNKPAEMTPSELGFTGSMWKSMIGLSKSFSGDRDIETATFTREPSRTTLTEPPAGYRTPSATQPYGINGKTERAKAAGPADRQVEGTGYGR